MESNSRGFEVMKAKEIKMDDAFKDVPSRGEKIVLPEEEQKSAPKYGSGKYGSSKYGKR